MDFIMFYEHHAREVDGLLLLKAELAKRGHTAELVHYTFGRRWLYHRFVDFDVAVVPFLYNDMAAAWTMARRHPANKLVNLQWEQIMSLKIEDEDIVAPRGEVRRKAAHLCLGEKGARRLQDKGIPAERIYVTGALHLDLCTNPFRPYYRNKAELAEEAGLSPDRRWLLFVSNLVFANEAAPASVLYQDSYTDYIDYSKRCLAEILNWAKKYCDEHPEIEFIYRPHPSEAVTGEVLATADSVENFHIIRDGTAREWVLQSDACFVHNTTTIAEIYAAGKTCGVLRPEPCPEQYDMPIYSECTSISDYDAFTRCCEEENAEFPVSSNNFREYYDHRNDPTAYKRICDVLEESLNWEETGPDVISLLERSDDSDARNIFRFMDEISFFSELFRHRELKMAGVFSRMMELAPVLGGGFSPVLLRDWPWQSEIPEKQRKLCDIIGAQELPDMPYLEQALEAHRRGEDWSDFDFESYDAVGAELERLAGLEAPEPKALFAVLKDLLPLSGAELDDHGKRLISDNAGELTAAIRKLLHCEAYPSWEESHAAVGRFLEPLRQAKRVILYGAGGFAPYVKSACDSLKIAPQAVWDKRAEAMKTWEGIPAALPFSEDPDDGTLVLIALSYNRDYYPVRDTLLQRGYRVMDGVMVRACAVWEEALGCGAR